MNRNRTSQEAAVVPHTCHYQRRTVVNGGQQRTTQDALTSGYAKRACRLTTLRAICKQGVVGSSPIVSTTKTHAPFAGMHVGQGSSGHARPAGAARKRERDLGPSVLCIFLSLEDAVWFREAVTTGRDREMREVRAGGGTVRVQLPRWAADDVAGAELHALALGLHKATSADGDDHLPPEMDVWPGRTPGCDRDEGEVESVGEVRTLEPVGGQTARFVVMAFGKPLHLSSRDQAHEPTMGVSTTAATLVPLGFEAHLS
jgi:hypothetical protein